MHQEAAGAGDAGDHLGEVCGTAGWQGFQSRCLDPERGLAAAVAPGNELVDEAAPVVEAGEVAGAAQDQGLYSAPASWTGALSSVCLRSTPYRKAFPADHHLGGNV